MTKGIENLSEEQIQTIRQDKINEIYECVDELREQCELNGLKVVSLIGKQCISGFAQTPHYLSMLENDESFEKVLNLEKTYWSDKSIIGLSGHLEVACIKV